MNDQPGNKVMTKEFLAERDARIFKMRQAGVAVAEIAKRFGVATSVVNKAVNRQLAKLNSEALMAYPEVLRMELERLDSLQAAIWPMTQHRKVKLDDGSEIQVEPDIKAINQVLQIMDRRSKLLGMDNKNVNVQLDVTQNQVIKASLVGENNAVPLNQFNPEQEARQLLEIMSRAGILPDEMVGNLLKDSNIIDAEEVPALEYDNDSGDSDE
jgi:hypothetical protein